MRLVWVAGNGVANRYKGFREVPRTIVPIKMHNIIPSSIHEHWELLMIHHWLASFFENAAVTWPCARTQAHSLSAHQIFRTCSNSCILSKNAQAATTWLIVAHVCYYWQPEKQHITLYILSFCWVTRDDVICERTGSLEPPRKKSNKIKIIHFIWKLPKLIESKTQPTVSFLALQWAY